MAIAAATDENSDAAGTSKLAMRYPGGKGQAGVYQRIINLMPEHDIYIEPFVGGGNILERKKAAIASIAIDADEGLIEMWKAKGLASTTFICGDAISYLRSYKFNGKELLYCDPPYVMSSRKSGPIYKHEMTDQQHAELLSLLRTIPAAVMLSGYWCPLYEALLTDWNRIDFTVVTRAGKTAVESLWFNFPPPERLHDYKYLGCNFRERERIKRKQLRWRNRLAKLPMAERAAMMQVLLDLAASEMTMRPAISSIPAISDR
jgi:DNA adenine methylase